MQSPRDVRMAGGDYKTCFKKYRREHWKELDCLFQTHKDVKWYWDVIYGEDNQTQIKKKKKDFQSGRSHANVLLSKPKVF